MVRSSLSRQFERSMDAIVRNSKTTAAAKPRKTMKRTGVSALLSFSQGRRLRGVTQISEVVTILTGDIDGKLPLPGDEGAFENEQIPSTVQ